MRARRREINIFNMSLLDILCGALGAFCFMMLVALPYYKPAGSAKELREAQAETQKLLNDLENLQGQMVNKESVDELKELLKRLEAQIKVLQGQVNILSAEKEELERRMNVVTAENGQLRERLNQLTAEKEQLEARINQLTAENQRLAEEMEKMRVENATLLATVKRQKPFAVRALLPDASDGQSVEIFIEDDELALGGAKSANAVFDPQAQLYKSGWMNDITNLRFSDGGATVWISASTVPGVTYKIFLKEGAEEKLRKNMEVLTIVDGDFAESKEKPASVMTFDTARTKTLPALILGPERPWGLLGTLTVDAEAKLTFKAATAAERDEEWRKLMKTEPPPFPTPVPPPPRPVPAEVEQRRREMRERALREREKTSPGEDERARFERLRQGVPPPPPRPSPAATP
ncbi:MAG: hypothetical protein H0X40_11415 [Chthoniobacterales bacterium]|nr:hypothetical protein [Chthoniobacterales bacterium]